MSNTSATGGYLTETPEQIDVTALENIWHDIIAGITALDNKLVRPSRSIDPARQPKNNVNWVAFEIARTPGFSYFPPVMHRSAADGHDEIIDYSPYTIRAAFYGPDSDRIAGAFRRGLFIWQNRQALRKAKIALLEVGSPETLPELDSMRWRDRADVTARFVVENRGRYEVLNLLQSGGALSGNDGTTAEFNSDNVLNN